MSNSISRQDLWEAVKNLVDAPDAFAARQVLAAHPELQERKIEQRLTQQIRQAWRNGEVGKARDYLACRTFLIEGWQVGFDHALAQVDAFPMAANSRIGRLLKLTYNENDLSERVKQAQHVLANVRRDTEPELWADLHGEIADCLLRSKGKEHSQKIELAIWHNKQALAIQERLFPRSKELAETYHITAKAYFQRVRGNRSENLHIAIRFFERALTIRTLGKYPNEWAATQHSLGNAWFSLTTGDRKQNIENSVQCYRSALIVRTHQKQPEAWMMTAHQMGVAHTERIVGSRMENIEKAIAYCRDVLEHCSEDDNPLQWGRSQTVLGNAYIRRLLGDRTQNIERAIRCYQRGIRGLSGDLDHWAMAHSNLAVAYFWRSIGSRVANLEKAVKHHLISLEVYTKDEYPVGWARTLTNLGNLYWRMQTIYQDDSYLYQAVDFLKDAGTVRTEEQDPVGWALVQHDLGNVYADLKSGDPYDNSQKAIACYENALKVRTRKASRALWAETTNNLGTVYTDLVFAGYNEYASSAIDCYQQALDVHTPEAFPFDCRRASRNLARLLFLQQRWGDAADSFQKALTASEYLYQAGATPIARQVELEETRNLPSDAAFSLTKADRLEEAVVVLEKNRARALGEAMARNAAALANVSEADRVDFVEACGVIATWEAEVREYNRSGRDDFLDISVELEKARGALTAVIQRIRQNQPDFMPEGLEFQEIGVIAASLNQPIVYLVTTVYGSVALLVPPSGDAMQNEHIVWCEQFSSFDLQKILGNDVNSQGYLNSIVRGDITTLQNVLSDSWPILNDRFMSNIVARIQKLGFQRAVLIPTGQLSLLPLHAFSEDVVFSVVPSARSLQGAARCEYDGNGRFLGIGNPLPLPGSMKPLAFAQMEVEEIASQFPDEDQETFVGEDASLEAVQASQASTKYLHFACHGGFNLKRPLTSSLFLANKEQLTLQQLLDRHLDLSAVQLVVLSACKTGVIEFENLPDEVVGFPAGFLQVGIPAVISTLWAINDVSTSFLMPVFYDYHLSEGLPPADALKAAQNWLQHVTVGELKKMLEKDINVAGESDKTGSDFNKNSISKWMIIKDMDAQERPFAHPYYWASFVYTGP